MESGQIFVIVIVALVTGGVALSAIATAWFGSRKARTAGTPLPRLDAIEARLSRMEEMMETVALEMERVAEGQRFTAKLLADRAAAPSQAVPARVTPNAEGRVNTPH